MKAALNNAEWCAAVWRSHNLPVEQADGTWLTRSAVPTLYPNVVTVDPQAETNLQLNLVACASQHRARFAVKDSFAVLPLNELRFAKVFDAQWLWSEASTWMLDAPNPACRRITDAPTFAMWVEAWEHRGGGIQDNLLPTLLSDQRVEVWGNFDTDERLNSGMIAYRSPNCVGISNLFGSPIPILGSLAAVEDKPIVCWLHGTALAWALERGFESVGPLTVWMRE